MGLYPTHDAEPQYSDSRELIGYVRQHTPELWLPLDTNGDNLGPPTYKADAIGVVRTYATDSSN